MDGRRAALIVASDEFEHAGLSRLQAPSADAESLAGVLGDPDIGGFEVRVVHNSPSHTVQAHVEDLFAEGQPDDLLLLHFSGHGLKSDSGELFFAATNTRPDRLASTAVSADFVQRCMRGSRARSIVLFLDCCYGGAFGEGVSVRAAGPANVLDSFPAGKLGGGRGRAVITASSAMEYAFEGSALATDDQRQPSVFTSAVVEGLTSGAADRDEDGLVSLNELYDYVFDQVRAQNPNQTPSRDIELQGELYVAKSRRKRIRAVPLPPDLRAAVQDDNMYTRLGAVGELRARLASADLGVALGAREALEEVARSDTSYVAEAARDALTSAPLTEATSPGPPPQPPPAAQAEAQKVSAVPPPALLLSPAARVPETVRPPAAPDPSEDSAAAERPEASAAAGQTEASAAPHGREAPSATAEPSEKPETPASPAPRHRVTAGRTSITGGSLMLLSAVLPEYVYADTVWAFGKEGGFTLVALGALAVGVGASTLWLRRMGARWPWLVTVLGGASLLSVWGLLSATADLGASDIYLGIWVALAGCLTTAAAGVVAMAGRRPRPDTSQSSHPESLTPLARAVGNGALVASGAMISATFAVRFVDGTQALVEPDLVWAWLFPGFVGLTAGILTLRLRRWPQVGPALVGGAGAAAIWGVWDLPRIWNEKGTAALNTGFFLEFTGLIGLVTVGVVALVTLKREHDLTMTRPEWRTLALTAPVGLLAAVPFLRVARGNLDNSETGNAAHDIAMAVIVVLVPVLTAVLRPVDVGRYVLLGWCVAATGTVIAYWRLLREGGYPLFGIPYVLLALAVLAVLAVAVPRRTPSSD